MCNHFHLLVRVPHRPVGFDLPLEVLVARLERAVGEMAAVELRKQLDFWETTKNEAAMRSGVSGSWRGCFASLGWLCS